MRNVELMLWTWFQKGKWMYEYIILKFPGYSEIIVWLIILNYFFWHIFQLRLIAVYTWIPDHAKAFEWRENNTVYKEYFWIFRHKISLNSNYYWNIANKKNLCVTIREPILFYKDYNIGSILMRWTNYIFSYQIAKNLIGRIKQKINMIIFMKSITEQRKNHLDHWF